MSRNLYPQAECEKFPNEPRNATHLRMKHTEILQKKSGYNQALLLGTFLLVFRTLLQTSTMSQTIPDIHSYSKIFTVSEGISF